MTCVCEDRAEFCRTVENALLRTTGFFRWGGDSFIHKNDMGNVMERGDALELAVQMSKEKKT